MIMIGIQDDPYHNQLQVPTYIREKSEQDYGLLANGHACCGEYDLCGQYAQTPEEMSGFGYLQMISYESAPSMEYMYYGLLQKTRSLLNRVRNSGSADTRNHYQLLLLQIDKAMQK